MGNNSHSESYKAAGVDITAGYEAVRLMKEHIARTNVPGVLSGIGGFGGLFGLDLSGIAEPVLVSGTDGVSIWAKPLFFLDYIAVGKNKPERVAAIVSGVAEGCVQSGCALIGGETAEMPGFYPEEEYDLAGFAVGVADKKKIIDSSAVRPGDAIIGLASSGVHSNGFSLVRKVFDVEHKDLTIHRDELGGSLGEALLTPTRIYVKPMLALLEQVTVKAVSHITGGGFYENIPRALPEGCAARIPLDRLGIPPLFQLIQREGNIPMRDMYNTFNMGVGMSVIVDKTQADKAVEILRGAGEDAWVMGEVAAGERGVVLC